jgi:predicted RND superfamily exporter protein
VKTVYRELLSGKEEDFGIPRDAQAVAQTLIQYQNSHRPQDLWHLVTPDYLKSVVWVQLRSGDNRDMSRVVAEMGEYIRQNPPPVPMEHDWFGLTYINVVWQDKMVSGMLQAFLGSFLAVFLMMTLLYRSALWGMLCMLPLTLTILIIYGVIGLVGKDYDMPVAVLSALSLGLAVDYAIHFLSRSRKMYEDYDSWDETVGPVFGEPARAITRNVIVVGVGFLPLIFAPLVPYQTVGIFISSILVVAGAATLLLLPSLLSVLERLAFPRTKVCCLTCRCGTCIASAVAGVALIAVNVHQFLSVGYTRMTTVSLIAIAILAGGCYLFSRREKCKVPREDESPA